MTESKRRIVKYPPAPGFTAVGSNSTWSVVFETSDPSRDPRGSNVRLDFQCWPDTVDPRGPKGK